MKLQEIIRNEEDQIVIPIVTVKRGETSIVLIGMIHIASKDFFETVLSHLNIYEKSGFQILYEEVEAIPSAEKQILDSLFKGLQKYGLYSQLEYLHPRTSWKSADMTQEMSQNSDDDSLYEENHNDDMSSPEKYIRNILLPQLENPSLEIPGFEVVINRRNEVAVRVILDHVEKTNVATFWGCSHLPGMIDLLGQAGFQIDTIEWIKVLDIENLRLQVQHAASL